MSLTEDLTQAQDTTSRRAMPVVRNKRKCWAGNCTDGPSLLWGEVNKSRWFACLPVPVLGPIKMGCRKVQLAQEGHRLATTYARAAT